MFCMYESLYTIHGLGSDIGFGISASCKASRSWNVSYFDWWYRWLISLLYYQNLSHWLNIIMQFDFNTNMLICLALMSVLMSESDTGYYVLSHIFSLSLLLSVLMLGWQGFPPSFPLLLSDTQRRGSVSLSHCFSISLFHLLSDIISSCQVKCLICSLHALRYTWLNEHAGQFQLVSAPYLPANWRPFILPEIQ